MLSQGQTRHEDAGLQQTLLRIMKRLKASGNGSALRVAIKRTLEHHAKHGEFDEQYALSLYTQLSELAQAPGSTNVERIRTRLIQQHLLPYLPPNLSTVDADITVATQALAKSEHCRQSTEQILGIGGDVNTFEQGQIEYCAMDTSLNGAMPAVGQAGMGEVGWNPQQATWWMIKGALKQISGLKRSLAEELQLLNQQREELNSKLDHTSEHIKVLEDEGNALRSELGKARKQVARQKIKVNAKMSKKWNALPKQPALVKQLQAEIERAKRSGSPLALARININDLEKVVQEHGEQASAAILACYADEILSSFRLYDFVVRCNDQDVAVLLPDTGQEGAVRALEKAQKRAAVAYVNHNGNNLPLPGFCGAVALYTPGEDITQLLQRIDGALATATELSDNELIVA